MLRDRTPKLRPSRRGVVAVLAAVSMVGVMGIVAIALDGGVLMDDRRQVQAAVDAAALAAAGQLFHDSVTNEGLDPKGTARAVALANAAANGYSNDGTRSIVTVNIPPTSGRFAGRASYAEVIIQFNQPRAFSGIFGSGDIPVQARAVARGQWAIVNNGIICLDLNEKGALNAHGNGTVSVEGAPIIVNSNHADAATRVNGSNALVSAPDLYITGGYETTGGAQIDGDVHTGTPPVPDPLRYLPPPNPADLPLGTSTSISLGGGARLYTLRPGRFPGGLNFSSKDSVILLPNADGSPGIYYMEAGGFSFSGQGSLVGTNVMIYNAPTSNSHDVSISGQGAVSLSPPTSGIYKGMSIFQDRNADVPVSITGNGQFNVRGTVYAANAHVMVEGNGDLAIASQYISRTLDVGGNGNFNVVWDAEQAPRRRVLQLCE
jgi:hypothetical protein